MEISNAIQIHKSYAWIFLECEINKNIVYEYLFKYVFFFSHYSHENDIFMHHSNENIEISMEIK